MRIHRLEISAFGPFAATEHIDFDRLSAHGLFLLNGPTGAGKTSVLDAICFALYGSVPGARQDGKRLRSDHAEAAAEPRVTCEFSARGRHFEVSRSPAWDKPSARGKNGFTVQQANTLLRERVDGQWIEKSGRNDEAGAEIADVLGMNREQFTRVVMLPQGDFAAFLRSKATDRLELLQSLFGTQRFEAVEQELARKAQAARAEVATITAQLELLLAQAEAETAPLELATEVAPDKADPDLFLTRLQAQAAGAAEQLRAAATEADGVRADRLTASEAATARAARVARLAAAEIRRSTAEAAAPATAARIRQLGLHRQAEVLGGQLQAVDSAGTAEEAAATAMAAAAEEVQTAAHTDPELAVLRGGTGDAGPGVSAGGGPGGMVPGDGTGVDSGALGAALRGLRSVRAVLEERLPDEARLAGFRGRSTQLRLDLARLEDQHASGTAALAVLRHESESLLAGLRPLEELASEEQMRTKEAAAAEELLVLVRRHADALTVCTAVTERHGAARTNYQNLRQRWLDLREERLANAAAELASQLLPGIPCSVCGSPDHPAPAPAAASALTVAEAEETAQHACELAETALAALERELSEAQQRIAVLAAQGGDTACEDAAHEAALAKERAAEARRAATDLVGNRARHAQLEEEIAGAEQGLAAAASGIAQTGSTLAEVREQAESLELALDKLRAGHPVLAARITALEATTAVLEHADEARTRLEQATARSFEARQHLELALPGAGFESADAARAVLLPSPEAAALEAAIRSAQDEAARIEELFASEDLVLAATERDTAGPFVAELVDQLRADAVAAERSARDAELAAGLAEKTVRTLDSITANYAQLAAAGREPRERAALLAAVADAARGAGDNTYRMSLNSYVLAARLEQVAVAASERLIGMSDGRYTLQHTDAKAARGQKSGLGLEVVDQWTGQRRDTATLSGGESFMASLALALGLADVVQQESGGVDIETLFVDEGFGSLDEQALEQVMDALEGLRDGGRVVGLVSHVGEMKQRISTQLQVVKGRNGSTLRISDDAQA
ncbi:MULTISPECIES: SMC family ATPase [unclassified Arthrobacter]|uniref:SMC family ATPase n=1 Tax=unclassified Arthrobacter TaxID=235627 RepID=UPI002E0A196C|nr:MULTISPECIES: SMC family ATPase [unclassified Arthrobacter]MEC5191692.1 exonuclease SbcC [Arthrobacter sp. MP_M4]MEC5203382.1 exonuclease SbcC [Arthrobacter sp. MP_M7]